ncbi:class I adenylate-forming enzyme family protein [Spirochaeta isovalerica]|uniref:Acyl-CoA synthetase (AMP-forming)/AMP-acid ligase II n=1 Tax=Spirochaeta isovalerica TaxID=150 RepID=A0A841R8E9_9SPIO|nr:class I adenylate-forming enzyme family protein [Spirochaeta isovalerica]MBB6479239.1 acyl-CoA synthetase (AMP-forming)/AMP-acid ligase II [Spirochaeta isovalerica]
MQVHDLLNYAAINSPEKDAVWYKDEWMTYRQLGDATDRIASFLLNQEFRKGDRVALLLENSHFYVASYFAILKAGGVVVGISTDATVDRLQYQINDSEARILITQTRFMKIVNQTTEELTSLRAILLEENTGTVPENGRILYKRYSELEFASVRREFPRTIDIDLAEIVYTSGSTGKPKGVMLTHLNLVTNMKAISSYLHMTGNDRMMVILPFTYIYGKSLLLTHVLKEASVVIDNRFVFPNKVLDTMEELEVTGFSGVPSTYMILLNRSTVRERNFSSLRYVTQAGGSMAPVVQEEVVKAFSPAQLYIMYGATEAAPRLSYLEPEYLFERRGSIGKPVDNVELLVCDSEGNELPPGEVGEITARGSNIMIGYWRDPEETAKVLRHGMYYTGDLGKVDEDGFFYVVGRSKEMIKVKGFRVGIKEIEDAILELEDVVETAVVGVDDPLTGEAILALIIPRKKDWNGKEQIRNHLKKRVPAISQPAYIEFRDSFPKNSSGKILKAQIKGEENKKDRSGKTSVVS